MKHLSFNAPAIAPLPQDGSRRPFWSVMIPVYNPPLDYLEQTLQSVLAQDPGPDQMQIEIVDDCSPRQDWAELVRNLGGDRIKVSQTGKNLGLAGCWNTCIERARGEWVHILHQDDLVLPGFYFHLRHGIEGRVDVGAAFCRFFMMDSAGHWQTISDLNRQAAGILENWQESIARGCCIQCPAIVIRRSVYELLGGFNLKLTYSLDWEMWQRIAAHEQFWFEPGVFACYRMHPKSATSRLQLSSEDLRDIARAVDICRNYLPVEIAKTASQAALDEFAKYGINGARKLLVTGQNNAAWKRLSEAVKLSSIYHLIFDIISFLWLAFRVFGSRLKRRFIQK